MICIQPAGCVATESVLRGRPRPSCSGTTTMASAALLLAAMACLLLVGPQPVAADSPSAWVASSLARIMPDSQPPAGQNELSAASVGASGHGGSSLEAAVSLAGNEHESFQVAVRSAANVSYTVDVGDATAAAGDFPLQVSWSQVGLVNVSAIVANDQGGAGWWPDPVLPTTHAFGVAGLTTSVWFTVYSPPATSAGKYKATVTLTPTADTAAAPASVITVALEVTVYGFSLPTAPALLTAFNLGEANLAKVYNKSSGGLPPKLNITDSELKALWEGTGCSNPFSATGGEQPLWHTLPDGGAHDMMAYCTVTKEGTATPGQKAVCGSVPGNCTLQHLPHAANGGYDPEKRPGHR